METISIKDIPGYEGRYAASKCGRIWSHPKRGNKNGKWLKPSTAYHGYPNVIFSDRTSWRIHRLIAMTYLEPVSGKTHINHKNSIRHDNRVENIEWVTHRENIKHCYENKRRIPPRKLKKISYEITRKIIEDRSTGMLVSDIMSKYKIGKDLYYKIINKLYIPRDIRAQKNITLGRTPGEQNAINKR